MSGLCVYKSILDNLLLGHIFNNQWSTSFPVPACIWSKILSSYLNAMLNVFKAPLFVSKVYFSLWPFPCMGKCEPERGETLKGGNIDIHTHRWGKIFRENQGRIQGGRAPYLPPRALRDGPLVCNIIIKIA